MPINFANALMPFLGGAAQGVTQQLNKRQEEKAKEAAFQRYADFMIKDRNLQSQMRTSEDVEKEKRLKTEDDALIAYRARVGAAYRANPNDPTLTDADKYIGRQVVMAEDMAQAKLQDARAQAAGTGRDARTGRGGQPQPKPVKLRNLTPDEYNNYFPTIQSAMNAPLDDREAIAAAQSQMNQVAPFLEGTNYQHVIDKFNQRILQAEAGMLPTLKGLNSPGVITNNGSRGAVLEQGLGKIMDAGKSIGKYAGGPPVWAYLGGQKVGDYLRGPASEGMNPFAGMNPLPAIGNVLQQVPTESGRDIWGNPLPAPGASIWQSPLQRRAVKR